MDSFFFFFNVHIQNINIIIKITVFYRLNGVKYMNEHCVKRSKNINEINIFKFCSNSEIVVKTIVIIDSLK